MAVPWRIGPAQAQLQSAWQCLQKKYSVCQITSPATRVNGEPREGGLEDLRMGSDDRYNPCTTDGMDREDGCPGYFGHIELATPLYHIGFNRTVLKVLRCVGFHTSKLLLNPNNEKDAATLAMLRKTLMGPARLERAMAACATKKSDWSGGSAQPKFKMDPEKHIGIKAEWPAQKNQDEAMEEGAEEARVEREQLLSGRVVHEILRNITDEDCLLLGFDPRYCRPDWMMIKVLPVPPPAVRPAIEMDSTGRAEDDLTHQYAQIVKDNNALRAHMASGSPEHVLKARPAVALCD